MSFSFQSSHYYSPPLYVCEADPFKQNFFVCCIWLRSHPITKRFEFHCISSWSAISPVDLYPFNVTTVDLFSISTASALHFHSLVFVKPKFRFLSIRILLPVAYALIFSQLVLGWSSFSLLGYLVQQPALPPFRCPKASRKVFYDNTIVFSPYIKQPFDGLQRRPISFASSITHVSVH